MSKYNEYARRLDKAFRDVVREYNDLVLSVKAAERTVDSYANARDSVEIALKNAAIATLNAKREEFRRNSNKLLEQFCRDADGLTMELKAAAADENCVNPKDVDANAMELLKSGVMNGSDYAAMVERYSGNTTMLRLIGKYADEARRTAENPVERQKISIAMIDAQRESISVADQFEELAEAAKIYCGKNAATSINYVQSMQEEWNGTDIQAAIENF